MLRFLKQYRLAIISFSLGLMVVASISSVGLVWAANETSNDAYTGSTATLAGCPIQPICSAKTDGVGMIIPQCQFEGQTEKQDGLQCCNYTLDAFIQLAINISQFILGISGSVALCMIIYGGFIYLTSTGDAKKIQQGSQTFANAGIGLLIIFGSWVIINFVMGSLVNAPGGTTTQDPTALSSGTSSDQGSLNRSLRGIFKLGTSGTASWSYKADICTPIQFGQIAKVDNLTQANLNQTQTQEKLECESDRATAEQKAIQKCGTGKYNVSLTGNTYCYACIDLTCSGNNKFIGDGSCNVATAQSLILSQPVKSRVYVSSQAMPNNKCCYSLPPKDPGSTCEDTVGGKALSECPPTQYCTNPDNPTQGKCMIKKSTNEECSSNSECQSNTCAPDSSGQKYCLPKNLDSGSCCMAVTPNGATQNILTQRNESYELCQKEANLGSSWVSKFYCPGATSCGAPIGVDTLKRYNPNCNESIQIIGENLN